jgi:hypothetical protein
MNTRFLVVLLLINSCRGHPQRLSQHQYQKGVVDFFVETGFLDGSFANRWEKLSTNQERTSIENHRLMRFHDRINNAARRYQKEYGLYETGIVDGKLVDRVFGSGHSRGMIDGLF